MKCVFVYWQCGLASVLMGARGRIKEARGDREGVAQEFMLCNSDEGKDEHVRQANRVYTLSHPPIQDEKIHPYRHGEVR